MRDERKMKNQLEQAFGELYDAIEHEEKPNMKPEEIYIRPTCCCCNRPADIKEENVNWCADHYQLYGNKTVKTKEE
jgi:hypothetical protein